MHNYLKSIGFSEYQSNKRIRELKKQVLESPTRKEVHVMDDDENYYVYEKDYGECFGLCLIKVGATEEDSDIDSFYPYVKGSNYLFNEKFDVDHCSDHEGYFGYCDDNNIGIPLIFSVNNPLDYRRMCDYGLDANALNCVTLSGLATDGVVLLPIERDEYTARDERKKNERRNVMIDAAKSGNVEAMEKLTIDDMTTFTQVNIRSRLEDIFTIVNSYFMPHTVECDKYAVLAEITEVNEMKNRLTGEELYYMSLNCNSIEFEVMINKKNLLGIPMKGRRWKGHIWMQGQMDQL